MTQQIAVRGGTIQKQLADDIKDSLTSDTCVVEKVTTLYMETDKGTATRSMSVHDTSYDSARKTWTIVYKWAGDPPYVDTYYRRLELRTGCGKTYAVYEEDFYVSSDVDTLEVIWEVYIRH